MTRLGKLETIGLAAASFLVVLVALFAPEAAIWPTLALLVLLVWLGRRGDTMVARRKSPCAICAERYRIGDMVEHHAREHRECAS